VSSRLSQQCGLGIRSEMWHCVTGYVVRDVSRQCSGLMFKGVKVCKDFRLLKMRTLQFLEMS
jgi:hypothetical protein